MRRRQFARTDCAHAGVTQKELLGQSSSKNGCCSYRYVLNDRYGNPQLEKVSHGGKAAYVEHDPVTGGPLLLRDTDQMSVHLYIANPIDGQIRMVKDNGSSSDVKSFDPFGARDEKVTTTDRDVFDPYRYRFGLVYGGGRVVGELPQPRKDWRQGIGRTVRCRWMVWIN